MPESASRTKRIVSSNEISIGLPDSTSMPEHVMGLTIYSQVCHTAPGVSACRGASRNLLKSGNRTGAARGSRAKKGEYIRWLRGRMANLGGGGHPGRAVVRIEILHRLRGGHGRQPAVLIRPRSVDHSKE